MQKTYNAQLATLMVAIHDHFTGIPFPEEIAWFVPYIREAIFVPENGNDQLCMLLDYVARQCGVPLPQEEEYGTK